MKMHALGSRPRKPTVMELFSGAGGLSDGFRQAGFRPVFAVENDPAAAATYRANFGDHVFCGPIQDVRQFPAADVIVGGPPCQGFSQLGKLSPSQRHGEMNELWCEYMRAVDQVKPRAFVIENVPQILKSAQFAALSQVAQGLGYSIAAGVVNAAEFGVPQKRKRALIVGLRKDLGQASLPRSTGELRTVRDAIGDLPIEPDDRNWHLSRTLSPLTRERIHQIPPGGNRFDLMKKRPDLAPECWKRKPHGTTDVYGRLRWDEPALTIRTGFLQPGHGRYLHPEADRPITPREAARLQSFDDSFRFEGTRTQVARQIGNAVPPRLARYVAEHIGKLLAAPIVGGALGPAVVAA